MIVDYNKPILKQYAAEILGMVVISITIITSMYYNSKSDIMGWSSPVIIKFKNVDGRVKVGSEVKISGIKVGLVSKVYVESKTYLAVIELIMDRSIESIPVDSIASIRSDSLIGKSFISIVPGSSSLSINQISCAKQKCYFKTEEPIPNIETIIKKKLK